MKKLWILIPLIFGTTVLAGDTESETLTLPTFKYFDSPVIGGELKVEYTPSKAEYQRQYRDAKKYMQTFPDATATKKVTATSSIFGLTKTRVVTFTPSQEAVRVKLPNKR